MRRFPCWLGALVITLLAGRGAAAEPAAASPDSLPIPLPVGARVHLELDAADDDLLGVAKSGLRGVNGQTVRGALGLVAAFGGSATGGGPVLTLVRLVSEGVGVVRGIAPRPGDPGVPEASLADLLAELHRLHLVVFSPGSPIGSDELAAFYETTFRAEGGHRALWLQVADARLLVVAFPPGRGFATVLVTGRGTPAIVTRGDGYPDLEAIAPILTGGRSGAAPMTRLSPTRSSAASGLPGTRPLPAPRAAATADP
jgi:hypothetical protein